MTKEGGPIAWMVHNRVTANLVMLFLIIGGALVFSQIKQEVFPEFQLDMVMVEVPYPGASPEEVEKGVILAIEDTVRALDGVKRVQSHAFEGRGTVMVELISGANGSKVLQDVKNAVDQIQSFPEEADRPIINLLEPRRQVVTLMLFGDQSRKTLQSLAEEVRDALIQIEGITLVEIGGVPSREMTIEVAHRTLRAYGLTLRQIASTVRQTALDLPGGGVQTSRGEVLLRTQERRDYAEEFGDIPIIVTPQGGEVKLEEIASIREQFEESDQEAAFNGLPAVRVDVFRVGDQTPLDISEKVSAFTEALKDSLPQGVFVAIWNDSSEIYRARIDLLVRNGLMGLLLVLLLLGIFLEPRLAFWVTMGIPTSIIGAFLILPWTGVSINMISLFAFILTLGIIVDDAIVVGENVYAMRERGLSTFRAAVMGAKEISAPVIFAVLTNMVAFIPLFFMPGPSGRLFLQIPSVVLSIFAISLIESLFILPAHLSHQRHSWFWDLVGLPSLLFEKKLHFFIDRLYFPFLKTALRLRYITVALGLAALVVAAGAVAGGLFPFQFLPRVDSDLVSAQAQLPFGAPMAQAREIEKRLLSAAKEVLARHGGAKISRGIYSQIGTPLGGVGGPPDITASTKGSHLVGVQLMLVPTEERAISGMDFATEWRDQVGAVTGVDALTFTGAIATLGEKAITIQLSHPSYELLEEAAVQFAAQLPAYAGIRDIESGVTKGKPQLSFRLKEEARSLGLTSREVADQIRSAFYGAEALRQQRGREEIKVMVRLPKQERRELATVEELILRTAKGGEIPLDEAVTIQEGRADTVIRHSEGRRVISVAADVEEAAGNANAIIEELKERELPALMRRFPGLSYSIEGEQREQKETLFALSFNYLFGLLAIFTLLAISFKSYSQPLLVMLSIPFGLIGALIGHMLLGYGLSIVSILGMIALSGVVVNDSLVLIVTTNRLRVSEKLTILEAAQEAARRRFRPIILTSLTTFFGLSPMIFEASMQARFLIPMAISLGFGVLFSTFIILFITPALYLILEDFKLNHRNREK